MMVWIICGALAVSLICNAVFFWRLLALGKDLQTVKSDRQSLIEKLDETSSARAKRAQSNKSKRVMRKREGNPPGILSGLNVLVADDEPVNIEVILGMLDFLGLTNIAIAKNGVEAVEYAQDIMFDLCLMDIQMPEMNGLDATTAIHATELNKNLPVIPVTGASRVVTVELCKQKGMTGFLQKPVELEKLRSLITQTLSQTKRKAA